jgi:glycosyltransferase involved in cell wall biosynthesis
VLNLITPISNDLGYGIVGLNVAKTLAKRGIEFSLSAIGNTKVSAKESTLLQAPLSLPYHPSWPTVKIYHQHDSYMPASVKRVFWPIFELDNFTEQETKALYNVDELIVCSHWAKGILSDHFDNYEMNCPKCSVVPLGIDTEIFYYREPDKKTRPLRLINIGKWEIRKGHDVLAEMVREMGRDVELWMMPDNPFISQEEDFKWKTHYRNILGDKVKFIPRMDTQNEVACIISMCDIGVFPSRAEGWNLDLVEVMAVTGVPAYCTEYSAHTEIINRLTTERLPLPKYELEPAWDNKWFFGQGNWAKLDINYEIEKMDAAIWARDTINPKLFAQKIADTFSWENSVDELLKVIK